MALEFSQTRSMLSPLGSVPFGWKLAKLKDITTKIGTGATPRGGDKVYLSTRKNFALIRSQHVFDRYFNSEGLAFISDEHAAELHKVSVQAGDLLLNITGDGITFARACLVPESILPACVNQHVAIIRPDTSLCLPGYLLSYLIHPLIKQYIESFNSGGSRRAITKGHIESFIVPLPPLPEQKAIAHILGTLDDKIELNREMNKTLEAMAQAIFKSWFVDFDPLRAKMEGRQPAGMDAATAELFPDEFEESGLGMIPKEWRVITLGDIASIKHGYAFKSEFFSDPGLGKPIVVNIGNFKYTGGFRFESTTLKGYIGEYPEEFILSPGDILLVMTCQTAGGEILGIPGTIPNDGRVYLHNQRMGKVVIIDSTRVSQEFLYQLFLLPEFNRELFNTASGTKILHTSPTRIEAFNFCLPPIQVQLALAQFLRNLELQCSSNDSESVTLASIRDTLLPKLLSGEIRVKEAEKVVETVL